MNKNLTSKSIRPIIGFLLALAMAGACLFGCASPTNEGSSSNAASSASSVVASDEMTIAVEIDPTAAEGKVDLPASDFAATSQDVTLLEGDTAYEALVATGAVIEGSPSYVTSINGLAEKAAGPTYGWMYEVNGEAPTVAADEYKLQPDDDVRWYYGSWDEH